MDRLTQYSPDFGTVVTSEKFYTQYGGKLGGGLAIQRLGQYEDTSLTPAEVAQLKKRLEIVEGQRDAALEDLYYIHCAGQKGCAICCNADQCGESDSHIGDCTGFEWRGPQRPKEAE